MYLFPPNFPYVVYMAFPLSDSVKIDGITRKLSGPKRFKYNDLLVMNVSVENRP